MRHVRRTFGHIAAVLSFAALAAGCGGAEPAAPEEAAQAVAGTYCSDPSFSVSQLGPGQAVLSARSSCGAAAPSYRFMVKAPGATQYTVVRDWTVDGDAVWNLPVLPSGRYALLVWVRPADKLVDYDATATASFNVGNACGAPAKITATVNGSTLDLSASATCTGAATPEYRFFVKPPGATAYKEVRPYGPDPKASYGNPDPGRYDVLVYTRAAGNASDYEGSASASARRPPSCTSAALTATTEGWTVNLAATAACGAGTPEFRFLVRPPGRPSFVEFQPYGPYPNFPFAAYEQGRYEFQVWTRVKGNASDWEAQATASVLVGQTCSTATLAATWDGNSGVNLDAGATCPSRTIEYRLLVRRPGATTFFEVRPWSTDSHAWFDIGPARAVGRYEFKVYARVAGNLSDYEATAIGSALVGKTCSAATLSATYDGATRVLLSAGATCAYGSAELRFLVRPPGAAAFTELRPYAPDFAFQYDVPPSTSGRIEFQVQARYPGNASDWEATATASSFVGATCAFAGLSSSYDGNSLVQLAASGTCAGGSPEYRFFVRRPGEAAFSELRGYGPDPQALFSLYQLVPGRYEFKVWVRAAGNPSDWEAAATSSVSVGSGCTSATLTAAFDGNARVDLSSTASCTFGREPEYRFLVRAPGAAAFTEVRGYSPEPAFPYHLPYPAAPGRYELQVYVRAYGNTSDYEATAKATTLVGTTCSSATLSARGVPPPGEFMYVDLEASAVCGAATPEYRFLVRRPGEPSFSQLAEWGPSPVATLAPTVGLSGKYELQVQVRARGNLSDFEATASLTVSMGNACTWASLDARPDAYGATLSSLATCTPGAVPEYRFLARQPGESGFRELRPWDPNPGFPFAPYPFVAGRYEFQVQVRARGNVSAYEATASAASLLGPTCGGATLAATGYGPPMQLFASSSCSLYANPEYRFLVKGPGESGFIEIRPWAADPNWYYAPNAFRPGRYEFQVLVRAQGNRSEWEALASTSFLAGETCSGATLTATPGAGVVDLAATGTCFGPMGPEYRFLVKKPGEAAFTELRPYGQDPRFPFFPALVPGGRYEFQVWVRSRGNASDYEAIASATTFVGAVCTASALTAAFDQSGYADVAASASCRFGQAQYRFLVRQPGSSSSFREIRPYGVEPRLFWNEWHDPTSGQPSFGRWEFQVFVRVHGSVADESSATASTLVGPTCPGATLAASAKPGSVSLYAAAACLDAPAEYRFLAKPPGAAGFLEVRPYGPDPGAWFNPTADGRYEFQVQVRAPQNRSDYEAQATTSVLAGATCSTVTLGAVRDLDGWVQLEAQSSCAGGGGELRYLYRRAGAAAFTELWPYGPDTWRSWYVRDLAPGAYEVMVQARRWGNRSAFEASATLPLTIDAP